MRRDIYICVMIGIFILCGCSLLRGPPEYSQKTVDNIAECSGSMGVQYRLNAHVIVDELKKSGGVTVEALNAVGNKLMDQFGTNESKVRAYELYVKCINARNIVGRPKVMIIGSAEDYADYKIPELARSSVDLLHQRIGSYYQVYPVTVDYAWGNLDFIRGEEPNIIIIHASAFHHKERKNEAVVKFQSVISALMSLEHTQFIVFSRLPKEHPSPDLCERWNRQVRFLTDNKFKDRIYFYPLEKKEADFSTASGIEISQMTRCLTRLDPKTFCDAYFKVIEKKSQERIMNSTCNKT